MVIGGLETHLPRRQSPRTRQATSSRGDSSTSTTGTSGVSAVCTQTPSLGTHLQGEGSQGGDGDQGGHEEGGDVADGREGHAGSRALEALPGPVLRTRRYGAEGCLGHRARGQHQQVRKGLPASPQHPPWTHFQGERHTVTWWSQSVAPTTQRCTTMTYVSFSYDLKGGPDKVIKKQNKCRETHVPCGLHFLESLPTSLTCTRTCSRTQD